MCGINGIFAYADTAPPVDEAELLRTREHMIKRGPDGAGLWISPDRKVGLAHRRLAIIDLSESGAQPMATADGRLTIIFNGEIYNYRELRRELEGKGYVFRSQSDTEVLLYLYDDRGAEMVHALRGMFAFGIWDARERTLFLARDPFGIKPLYYADDGKTIRFASQVKALVAGECIACTPDPAGHVGFFLFGAVPDPHTLHRQIRAVPAGSTLLVENGRAKTPASFFDMAAEYRAAHERPVNPAAAIERLHECLVDSVRAHLVADVEVGLFLSAGVDSTVIAELANEANSVNMRALTLGFREFEGEPDDEVPLARKTAKALGFVSEVGWVGREEFESEVENILAAMDQPSIDGVNTYFVSKLAARLGLKVALSGVGGDEFFAGYNTFTQVPKIARTISRIPGRRVLGPVFQRATMPLFRRVGSPKYAGIVEYGGNLTGAYLLRRALSMPWELESIFGPEFAREGLAELDVLGRLDSLVQQPLSERDAISCLEGGWYMGNQLLRDADWASMRHSLEIRVPFVDVSVLRAVAICRAAGIAVSKGTLCEGFRTGPARVALARGKTGFSIPVVRWASALPKVAATGRGYRGWARYVYRRAVATEYS